MNEQQTPGIGHNVPPPFEETKSRVEELVEAANRWIAEVQEISNADQAGRCDDFKNQLVKERRRIDDERKAATEPPRGEINRVNSQYEILIRFVDKCAEAAKALKSKWLAHLDAEKQRKEAEAKAAAAAAEREAREAAEKAAAAHASIEQRVAADEAAEKAAAAAREADRVAREKVSVRGDLSQRATGYRTRWVATLVDIGKAVEYYRDHPKIAETVTQLANSDARSGRRRIPGFEIAEEKSVA